MKVILHIGMPKAGSTALQQTLGAIAPALRARGYCYPVGDGLPKNHNMLVCGFLEPERLPRLFRQIYKKDARRLRRDFNGFMTGIGERARASGAHTLILSGEMLFRKLGPKKIAALRKELSAFADEFTVIAYARSPAQFYMSQVQQVLKAAHKIANPVPQVYRAPLEAWEGLTDDIRVVAYAREQLHGADITRDFLHRISPDLDTVLRDRHIRDSNQSISAEGMDILHKYRLYAHEQKEGVFTPDTRKLLKLIGDAEGRIGGFTKPVAHASLREYLTRSSVDLLWLRDRHGVRFEGIDYDSVDGGLTPPEPPRSISDICAFDPDLRDRLMMTVMHRLAVQAAGESKMTFDKVAMPNAVR